MRSHSKKLGYSVYLNHFRAEALRKYEKNYLQIKITMRKTKGVYNQRISPIQNIEIRKYYIYPIFVVVVDGS
jgi:hypothetical protein